MPMVLGKQVGPIGFGLMGFTWRPEPPPLDQAMEAMKAALNNGLTVWNGAEFYGTPEYNSMTLLNHYFTKYPEDADKVTLIIKGGRVGSVEDTRKSVDNILKQLDGKKKLNAWSPARRVPDVPIATTFGALKEYIDSGKLGGMALSECSAETIREAAKVTKVVAVEVELSMFSPDILQNGIAAACAEHDIPILAYSPIGRGLLAGKYKTINDLKNTGMLSHLPRFQARAFEQNLELFEKATTLAEKKGCTPAQLAIGWVWAQSRRPGAATIIPIPGATTTARVAENSKLIELSFDEVAEIDEIVRNFEPVGGRYPDSVPVNT